jgi:leucyl-tRNA synthetase
MMEYINLVRERNAGSRAALRPLVLLLSPYAPHLAEELWILLGGSGRSVFDEHWPAYDERLAAAGEVEIAIQVNGKLRGRLQLPRGASQEDVVTRALKEEGVKKFVNGSKVKKVIYVQDRLVNLVV